MLHEIQIDYLIQPSRRNRKPTAPLTKAAEEKLKKRKLFECKECDFETYSRSEILAHRTTQRHEIENMGKSSERAKRTKPLGLDPPITCDTCNKQLTTMFMLYQHNRTSGCANKIKPFSCSKCNNYTTDRMSTLHKHEHNHDLAFACKVCGWKTGMKTRLKAHMLSKHADNLANFDDIPLNSFPAAITCHVCNETVNDERKMLEHNLRCSYKVNRLKCFYCLFTTNSMANLQGHMSTHTGVRRYACHLCTFTSAHRGGINGHLHLQHGLKFSAELNDVHGSFSAQRMRGKEIPEVVPFRIQKHRVSDVLPPTPKQDPDTMDDVSMQSEVSETSVTSERRVRTQRFVVKYSNASQPAPINMQFNDVQNLMVQSVDQEDTMAVDEDVTAAVNDVIKAEQNELFVEIEVVDDTGFAFDGVQ